MKIKIVNDNDNDNDKVNTNANVNDNVNGNDKVNDNGNDNVNTSGKGKDNHNAKDNGFHPQPMTNGNDNSNDKGKQVPFLSDDSDDDIVKYIYIFSEKQLRDKPNPQCRCGGVSNVTPTKGESSLWIDVNGILHSWLDNANIIIDAMLPDNFRCIISGPSECGKTVLLKNLFLGDIQFERLYIIGPTGDQDEDLKYKTWCLLKI